MHTNVSTPTLNIHRSKNRIQELQDSRVEETYISLIYFIVIGRISLTKVHLDGKFRQQIILKNNLLKMELQQKTMAITPSL